MALPAPRSAHQHGFPLQETTELLQALLNDLPANHSYHKTLRGRHPTDLKPGSLSRTLLPFAQVGTARLGVDGGMQGNTIE